MTTANNPVIRPTHSCFDDALDYIGHRVTENPGLAHGTTLRLVHGIAIVISDVADGLVHGEPFAHAWVEEDVADQAEPIVWQVGILDGARVLFAMPRSAFDRTLKIQASTAYTCREIWIENRRSGTYGPWRPEYLALCRRGKTASITCPRCGAVSYNPNDIVQRYCGRCHQFHEFFR